LIDGSVRWTNLWRSAHEQKAVRETSMTFHQQKWP
jgi:hypothetical protein